MKSVSENLTIQGLLVGFPKLETPVHLAMLSTGLVTVHVSACMT